MIGPEAPTTYEPDAWHAYVRDLRAYPDYPGRDADIELAQATASQIEVEMRGTGQLPSPEEMLRRASGDFLS